MRGWDDWRQAVWSGVRLLWALLEKGGTLAEGRMPPDGFGPQIGAGTTRGPFPPSKPPAERAELYEKLTNMLEGELSQLPVYLGLRSAVLPSEHAPRAIRAKAILDAMEGREDELRAAMRKVAPRLF